MSRSAYEITKLAFADVVTFRRLIQEIRSQSVYRRMSYEHSRIKIIAYHKSDSEIDVLDSAIEELSNLQGQAVLPSEVTEPKNNREVLEVYKESFALPFRPWAGDLPPEFDSFPMEIGGLRITGKPHVKVTNSRGSSKYLYLLTSKDWVKIRKASSGMRSFVGEEVFFWHESTKAEYMPFISLTMH